METNEIIENVDVQDVASEVVEDVADNGTSNLAMLGVAGVIGLAVIGGGYLAWQKAIKPFVAKKREEALEKEHTEATEVEVETEVIEN